jgi:adenine-specific DNA-methyltransferase
MPENRQELRTKLQNKLRELFQFNVSDLDFGIYKILNRKKGEIEQFIEDDLLKAIEKGLGNYKQEGESQLEELNRKSQKRWEKKPLQMEDWLSLIRIRL